MMSAETSDPTAEGSKVLFTHRFGSDSTETEFKSSIYSTHSALVTTFANTRLARVPKKTTHTLLNIRFTYTTGTTISPHLGRLEQGGDVGVVHVPDEALRLAVHMNKQHRRTREEQARQRRENANCVISKPKQED